MVVDDSTPQDGTPTEEPADDNKLPSLDDALEAAFKGDASDTTDAEAKADEPTAEPVPEGGEEVKAADEAIGEPVDEPVADAGNEEEKITPPEHWPQEHRETFATLDPAGQQFLIEREKQTTAEFTRKSQELSAQTALADQISALFTPEIKQSLAANGLDEVGAVRQLLALNEQARQDPKAFLQQMAQSLNVDYPAQNAPEAQLEPGDDDLIDPDLANLRRLTEEQLASTNQKVDQVLQFVNQRDTQALQTSVQNFQNAVDDAGNPAHPHFEKVKTLMGNLMSNNPDFAGMDNATAMEKAYDMAVRAHPEIGVQLVEAQAKQLATQNQTETQKAAAVAKAKAAASPVTGDTSPPADTKSKATDLDSIIKEAMSASSM